VNATEEEFKGEKRKTQVFSNMVAPIRRDTGWGKKVMVNQKKKRCLLETVAGVGKQFGGKRRGRTEILNSRSRG